MDSEPQTCPNPEITPGDWRRTPSSVQQMILHLMQHLASLEHKKSARCAPRMSGSENRLDALRATVYNSRWNKSNILLLLPKLPVNGYEYRTFRRYPQAFKRNMPTFPERSVLMRPRPLIQALLLCSFVSFSAVADDDDDDSGVP